ncbi:SDR family NAD(P)-dependent oxidoreductase [Zobellia sp. B3R18]|uniref:SDR family NAD(P)-dependent oxidoreductase n=1 Tax=Zobellia sp. B3R18 TaxID=2841568 RepID=UPI001C076F56|nr:SDR family oxidoreductase [Zobellia sp. B3R18]MBU2975661.1 SDR family oxidoreductase [Zobellia sp. B3R18]
MKFSLKDKLAVVTGGGSGIGRAICLALAEQGAILHILEMNEENAKETVTLIENMGGKVHTYSCNVAVQKEVVAAFKSITAKGPVDILINNAGIAHIGNLENCKEEDLDRLYDVNIKGVYNCMYASIDSLKQTNGVIINMASIASSVGINDRFAYSMTKGAVLTMTYSVAKDYLKDGIRCNCISPGRVHTPFVDGFINKNYPGREKEIFEKLSKTQPIGRMGKPEEVANLAVYLCSEEASFITGTNFPIDGGFVTLNGS